MTPSALPLSTTMSTCETVAPGASGGWLHSLSNWPMAALRALRSGHDLARIVVASVRGSAPREPGTCMLVEHNTLRGTIGGGQLELAAIDAARAVLAESCAPALMRKFVLGPELAQCCGGAVEVWIERLTPGDMPVLEALAQAAKLGRVLLASTLANGRIERRILDAEAELSKFPAYLRAGLAHAYGTNAMLWERIDEAPPMLWLYGAGHVGQALVRVLADLPMSVVWIDSRPGLPPRDVPASIEVLHTASPAATVRTAPSGAYFLAMTHSHALDYSVCRAVLERGDCAWIGVIGSKSKSARFRSRLARDGLATSAIATLACPIGIAGIEGKAPAVIAVAVAAQLLQELESRNGGIAGRPVASHGEPLCAASAGTAHACAACVMRAEL